MSVPGSLRPATGSTCAARARLRSTFRISLKNPDGLLDSGPMPIEPIEVAQLLALGLIAGMFGGIAGLGGSIVIIPMLTIFMKADLHLAQAAAMIVNVFVAAPALIRHNHAGAVRWDVFLRLAPFGIVFVLIGVESGNRVDGEILKKVFGVFLLYIILGKLVKWYRERLQTPVPRPTATWTRAGVVGATTGFFAGLLGVGGGPIAVPLLQRICHLSLRPAIATSSAMICATALVGAARKNMAIETLTNASGEPLGLHLADSLLIAGCVAPTAFLGAYYGAGLTHRLPLWYVRIIFVLALIWAATLMLAA